MAVESRRFVVCDIDRTDGAEEGIRFSLDGRDYQIDLMDHHARALRDALAPYIQRAALVGGGPNAKAGAKKTNELHQAVRAWARETGREVPRTMTKALIKEYELAKAA